VNWPNCSTSLFFLLTSGLLGSRGASLAMVALVGADHTSAIVTIALPGAL